MSVMETTLAEFDQESLTTKKLLEKVPEVWLSWRRHPRAYSLGQLAFQIAEIPSGIAAAASQNSIELPSFVQPEVKSRSENLAAFAKGLGDASAKLAGMDDAAAFATWTAKKNGKVVMSVPRIGDSAESQLSPPRPAGGLSTAARCACSLDLRSKRGSAGGLIDVIRASGSDQF